MVFFYFVFFVFAFATMSASASSSAHPWEVEDVGPPLHPWELSDFEESDVDSGDDEPTRPENCRDTATTCFLEILFKMYYDGSLSAEKVCTLCYMAHLGGMDDRVGKFGLKPESSSGHYARKLDKLLGLPELKDSLYHLPVAGIRKFDSQRATYSMPVLPIHELFDEECAQGPNMLFKLQEAKDEGSLPPNFDDHPVVQKHGGNCIPISLYFDSVAYTQTDSVLGMWLQNMLTHKKSLFCVFRKRLTCRCGCRGWYSNHPVLTFIKWCLFCLANGEYPSSRHCGADWEFSDKHRKVLSGKT